MISGKGITGGGEMSTACSDGEDVGVGRSGGGSEEGSVGSSGGGAASGGGGSSISGEGLLVEEAEGVVEMDGVMLGGDEGEIEGLVDGE